MRMWIEWENDDQTEDGIQAWVDLTHYQLNQVMIAARLLAGEPVETS